MPNVCLICLDSRLVIASFSLIALICGHTNCMFFAGRASAPPSCPPPHLFEPCECYLHAEHMKIIRCGGNQSYDLAPIFSRLSVHLSADEKHFHMFYLNNTAIARLGNVLADITFDYICKWLSISHRLSDPLFTRDLLKVLFLDNSASMNYIND